MVNKNGNKYSTIWHLLNQAGHLEKDSNLWAAWSRCVASAVYLESKFWKEVQLTNKPVYANLEGRQRWVGGDKHMYLDWCQKTYNVNHPLRFAVETLDSIEEIRVFLLNKSEEVGYSVHLNNLLVMTQPTFTFSEVSKKP